MNVDSLKTELQQVLDNDVLLRKEFTDLKRSLSDYRNQLIMRDEDCKRLQVTIDVLNTKLVVVERDCNNYKQELTTFKELRGTIQEQLQAKQEEIDARLAEIQALRDDINTMAAGYEQQIDSIKSEAGAELSRVKQEYTAQLEELRSHIHYKETGIKEEYENRVSELSMSWSDKEQTLLMQHDEEINKLKEAHADEINALNEQFISQLTSISSSSHEENASLKLSHQTQIMQMEEEFNSKVQAIENSYVDEIARLKAALEEQRSTLTTNFNNQIESLTSEFVSREAQLIAGYQQQIDDLRTSSETDTRQLSDSYTNQINHLKAAHELNIYETNTAHEARIASLIAEYEEKLSNTLIHSNIQNSKLNEELSRAQVSNESNADLISTLNNEIESKNTEISDLYTRLGDVEFQLRNETERLLTITSEFDQFRQNASLTADEKITELNNQIASLNLSHSDYAAELNNRIEGLNEELKNISNVFEKTTNTLGETEVSLELKIQELDTASKQIDTLMEEIQTKDATIGKIKEEIQAEYKGQIDSKEIEFQKLLVENSSLINEIDLAQDKIEAQEAEIQILKAELDEIRSQSIGKAEYFKETLSAKNFEVTNLEANNAAYVHEIGMLKKEVAELEQQLSQAADSGENIQALQRNLEIVTGEKNSLISEIGSLTHTINSLCESTKELNDKIGSYENEIEKLSSVDAKTVEQEAFIDRLFKQIAELNDQKMTLLDEKEQMAAQLLKMNEVVNSISQQVDSERIDVTSLNNHRKNVILATNSDGNQGSQMKEQINDLVREIDKCIALLSA
jgi:chromosome segregation ATPase